MKILVTGFTPFGGESINPSWQAVRGLAEEIGGAAVVKCEVPTEFEGSIRVLREQLALHHPDAVLCVGQFGGCASVRVERVAVNLRDARIPDNAGAQPKDEPVIPGGPAAYFATIPTRRIVETLQENGIPAVLSYSAGAYVCNNLLYAALHSCGNIPCGFIHLPYLPQQAAASGREAPSMGLPLMTEALTQAVSVIAADLTNTGV